MASPPDSVRNAHNITLGTTEAEPPASHQVTMRQLQSFQTRPLPPAPGSVGTSPCPHWEEHSRPSGATIVSDLSPPLAASLRDVWPELGAGQLLRAQETSGSRWEGIQGELEGPLSTMTGQSFHWTWPPSWTWGQEPGAGCGG